MTKPISYEEGRKCMKLGEFFNKDGIDNKKQEVENVRICKRRNK